MTELAKAAQSPGTVLASDLIAVLRERAPRLALAMAAGQMALPAARIARNRLRDRRTYTVKVKGNDELYDDLHEWVLRLLPRGEQRALVARTARTGMMAAMLAASSHPGDGPPDGPPPSLRLRYDGTREQAVVIAGHKVKVFVSTGAAGGEDRPWQPPEIIFTVASAVARDALLGEIGAVLRKVRQGQRKPAFRMLDKWGDWARLDDLPARDPGSVILPAGQMERLTADVGRFLAAEDTYARRCIPWHRGHLYAGPPGTGKTSAVRAIASHFGMDLWYLPLADVKKDGELLRVASRIGPRSVLLLEDVDVFHAATARDDETPDKVTLSGLLNALDGIATPHGLLTVLTTNTPEALDPAVIRPGRVDLVEHFTLAGGEQVARLIGRWYGTPVRLPASLREVAPSAVIEACKRSETADGAVADLSGERAALAR